MKLALAIGLSILIILIGVQAFSFLREENQLTDSLNDTQTHLAQAQTEEANLEAETQYLANPANLEKELRADFNYEKPGETMIIIVPAQSSTASDTSGNP